MSAGSTPDSTRCSVAVIASVRRDARDARATRSKNVGVRGKSRSSARKELVNENSYLFGTARICGNLDGVLGLEYVPGMVRAGNSTFHNPDVFLWGNRGGNGVCRDRAQERRMKVAKLEKKPERVYLICYACGCTAESSRHRDLLGYCRVHGENVKESHVIEERMPLRAINARDMEIAVAKLFNWRQNVIVPNVFWGLGLRYEADMFIVSPGSRKVREVEIKVTVADMKADAKKPHGHSELGRMVRQLYFAIPAKLLEKSGCLRKDAGIITVDETTELATIVRPAKIYRRSDGLSDDKYLKILHLGCMRIWSLKEHLSALQRRKGGGE